jgi:hypothetical protein
MNSVALKREIYKNLNSTYNQRYLHRFGRGGGFSAEFIHVLKAVAECLDKKIQFCLQSNVKPKGFAFDRGWTDYFEPLFPEVTVASLATLHRTHFPFGRFPLLKNLSRIYLKSASRCDYFVFDGFGSHPPSRIALPELGLGNDYWGNMQTLTRILWAYDAATALSVSRYKTPFSTRYNAIHIRRGDKKHEAGIHRLQDYADAIRRIESDIRDIFVATDDVHILDPLRDALGKGYSIFNSTNSYGKGYDQPEFNSYPISSRKEQTLRFFAELEMLSSSEHFVGASTSNVFNIVQYMRANKNTFDIVQN